MRTLELTINRRLDGVAARQPPGHHARATAASPARRGCTSRATTCGASTGTSRPARSETHVREQIADRDLEAWLVVDTSAAMRFGTAVADKAQVALAAAAVRRVPHRPQPEPPRRRARRRAAPQGDAAAVRARPGARRSSATIASPPPSEGLGRSRPRRRRSTGSAVVSRRRGFVAVDLRLRRRRRGSTRSPGSGCATTCWRSPSTTHASSTCRRSGWSRSSTRRPAAAARSGSRPPCSAATPRPPRRAGRAAARRPAPGRRRRDRAGAPTATGWRRSSATSAAGACRPSTPRCCRR